MDFNEEDSIIPILNQVKAFQSKWLAKNKQCETLESFLNSADVKNKELEAIKGELKSSLNASNLKNKEIKAVNAELKSSLKEANAKNKELRVECELLKSSLEAANAKNKELLATYGTTESSLISANVRIKELDNKCATLESLLHKVDSENKDLRMKLDKQKKEILEEKKKVAMVTLKKVQTKLLSSPLRAVIDRVKRNIEVLDEVTRNSAFCSQQKRVEVVDIASSDDDDDESTLSFVSEKQNIEEDIKSSHFQVGGRTKPSENSPIFSETTQLNSESSFMFSEELVPVVPTPSKKCTEDANRNHSRDIQIQLNDDNNYDSDISLSVNDDVTSTTAEEDNLDSSEILVSLACTSTIVNNQTTAANGTETEKCDGKLTHPITSRTGHHKRNVDEHGNRGSQINQDSASVKIPEISSVSVPELIPSHQFNTSDNEALPNHNQSKNILESHVVNDQVDSIVAKLVEKYGKKLKVLHRVVITPIQDESNNDEMLMSI